jgi:hypothetical protein
VVWHPKDLNGQSTSVLTHRFFTCSSNAPLDTTIPQRRGHGSTAATHRSFSCSATLLSDTIARHRSHRFARAHAHSSALCFFSSDRFTTAGQRARIDAQSRLDRRGSSAGTV